MQQKRWLNQQENDRENLDNIEIPKTKWVFVKFVNVEVEVVLDSKPLLGTRPLPAWRLDLARSLWRYTAVHQYTSCERARNELLQTKDSAKPHSEHFA